MAKKKKKKATASKRAKKRPSRSLLSKDLEALVGAEAYSTWIKMLKQLVPWGRTERLSVLVAAMLQYTASVGPSRSKTKNSAQQLIRKALGDQDPDGYDDEDDDDTRSDFGTYDETLLPLIETLFKDADVRWKRTNAKGRGYSIAEEAANQFHRWDFMPWE